MKTPDSGQSEAGSRAEASPRADAKVAAPCSLLDVSSAKPESTTTIQYSGLGSPEPALLPDPVYDCWNTIGVAGNASCQELLRFVHCRNCPVYSSAAVQLLDRPLTADYRKAWTEHYAGEKKLTVPAKTSVVIFRVGCEWLALPTNAFQEVAELRALHTLPHRWRDLVLGLVNVRGELLICVSLGRLLGLGETAPRKRQLKYPIAAVSRNPSEFRTKVARGVDRARAEQPAPRADRLMVANWEGNRIAFPVEEVHGIHRVHSETLRAPPATIAKSMHTYSRGVFAWLDHTVGLLNADAVFTKLNRSLT